MSSRWLGPAIRSCTCSPCTMIFHGAPLVSVVNGFTSIVAVDILVDA